MRQALRSAVANGRYRVDPDAVARAMLLRARALRSARLAGDCSAVLEAAGEIEVRRIGPCKADPFPFERSA